MRDAGAVPATIAVLGGEVRVGLDDAALERIGAGEDVAKCSVRDLPVVVRPRRRRRDDGRRDRAPGRARRDRRLRHGRHRRRAPRRGARPSTSPPTSSRSASPPICVVCAGVKSILDVGATLERLETLGVTVLGYRTDRFAGFYLSDSGHAGAVARRVARRRSRRSCAPARTSARPAAILVANPLRRTSSWTRSCTSACSTRRSPPAADEGIHGKAITPFLLDRLQRDTGGESLRANVALVMRNAALAGEIAAAAAAA